VRSATFAQSYGYCVGVHTRIRFTILRIVCYPVICNHFDLVAVDGEVDEFLSWIQANNTVVNGIRVVHIDGFGLGVVAERDLEVSAAALRH